jgi:protein-S-isoprenylcysteine O-methyltransferase Ste14
MAILVNMGLIMLFGLQHSIMARPSFKEKWTKLIPAAAERSTYVLFSGVIMGLICLYWQPIDGFLWQVNQPTLQTILIAGYCFGWILVVLASFLINHFELFGLQQVYLNLKNKAEPSPHFTDRWLYKIVRHPLQLGVLIGLWSTPTMSMTHLMLAVTMSIYVFIGLYYEEKDLVKTLGQSYEDYQRRVRMVVPLPK